MDESMVMIPVEEYRRLITNEVKREMTLETVRMALDLYLDANADYPSIQENYKPVALALGLDWAKLISDHKSKQLELTDAIDNA